MAIPNSADADVDPGDGRDESPNERLDRNWIELLQELRVTQTGTQILTGFLLAVAFQPRFASLSDFDHTIYLILVVTAALTTVLGLAPVNLHRGLFRRHKKAVLVRTAHVILRLTLAGVGLVLTGTVLLVFDVIAGRSAAYGAAGLVLLAILVLAALPVIMLRMGRTTTP